MIRFGAAGYSKKWKLKAKMKSPCYTTNINEILKKQKLAMQLIIDKKIKEILSIEFFDLSYYKEVVVHIVTQIYNANCVIYLAHLQESRYIAKDSINYISDTIRMGMIGKKNGLEFLWILFHEFGHHHDTPLDIKKVDDWVYRYSREIKAWVWAEIEMAMFPVLLSGSRDYIEYRNLCLSTYKNKIEK